MSARAQPTLAPQALFARVSPSIWVLQASDAQGRVLATGNAVALAQGKAATSCQLIAKASQLSLRRDNVSYGATLEFPDVERDICQLRVPNLAAPALDVVPERELAVGMPLYSVGAPRGKELALGISMLASARRSGDGSLEALQLSAPAEAGLAGAGLFDAQGRLAALVGNNPAGLVMPAVWLAQVPARGRAAIEGYAMQPRNAVAAAGLSAYRVVEYSLRDRLTGNTRKVVYKLDDETNADRRSFNNGTWVEKTSGEVLSVSSAIAGEFDAVMPPGGWVRGDMEDMLSWNTKYETSHGSRVGMDLRASVVEKTSLAVAGREQQVLRIDYRGHTQRSTGVGTPVGNWGQYTAIVWYAPELQRVVRFEAKGQGGIGSAAFKIDEELELSDIR